MRPRDDCVRDIPRAECNVCYSCRSQLPGWAALIVMPIKVTCQCGKSFAAKDELAGKAVKCPNCQQPLRIPSAGIAAPLPSKAPLAAAAPAAPAASPHAAGSLFDEVGLKAAPAGAMLCPGCAQPMPQNAVLCVKCGYNLKLGRRMETLRFGEGGSVAGAGAHGASTADLMNKAAVLIEEDKEAERSKTKEGMPWWVYLIGLLMVTGFVILMMVIPQQNAIAVAGLSLMGIGGLVATYAQIRMLIVAFNENVVQGLLFWFVPFYALFYIITRWDRCGGYFLMSIGGGILSGVGIGVIIVAGSMRGNDGAQLPIGERPRLASVMPWQDPMPNSPGALD